MEVVYYILKMCLCFFVPLLVVAIGGLYAEKSGVLNIALEGIMVMGAFCGILFMHFMQVYIQGQLLLILAMIVSMIAGGLFTLLHAFASISLKADQTISATALNTFAAAFAIFVARATVGQQQVYFDNTFRINDIPLLSDIPVIGDIFFQDAYITTFIGIAILIVTVIVFKKTRYGLRLSSCGENPQAADSLGINVYKVRYTSVLISGMLGGLGGIIYVVPIVNNFGGDVAGYGFVAMSVLILGQWKPMRIFVAALFFSFMKTIASAYQSVAFLANLGLPDMVYKCLPYVITLIVLAVASKNSAGPKAAGQPYDQGKR